jgi:hypothetical protein
VGSRQTVSGVAGYQELGSFELGTWDQWCCIITSQQYGNYRHLDNHARAEAHVNPFLSEQWPHAKDDDRIFNHDPGLRTGLANENGNYCSGLQSVADSP